MVAAAVAELPGRMSDFSARARENAALDYADLEVAGGNSLVADQEAVYQARAIIPPEATYDVSVGPGVEGATDLTPFVADYYHYFLMPRKQVGPARWVVCYACDRSDVGAHTVPWEKTAASRSSGGCLVLPSGSSVTLATAVLVGLAVVYLEGLFRAGRLRGLQEWDAWAFWVPKAKAIYLFGELDAHFFSSLPGPTYPPLVPALQASAFPTGPRVSVKSHPVLS